MSKIRFWTVSLLLCLANTSVGEAFPPKEYAHEISDQLERAGENRAELERALRQVPRKQKTGMQFLIAYMPERDLRTLSREFLLQHVQYAYKAWEESPWRESVTDEIFLNHILPYANITETRESWRKDFYGRFRTLVKDAATPGEAAVKLNQEIFKLTNVKFSTARNRPDQSPSETINSGLASCSGLSVMLIDACRSVGIPARFVGTPMWSNKSGNHSWVEVWSDGWHFTGACEPAGDDLDRGWFLGRAAQADRENPLHAIYAVSYRPTNQRFPVGWAPEKDWAWAVNVTDRYTQLKEVLPEGVVRVMVRCVHSDQSRLAASIVVKDRNGATVFQGICNDERFDSNDHLSIKARLAETYVIQVRHQDRMATRTVTISQAGELFTIRLAP